MVDECLQTAFLRVHESIEFGLRPMQRVRCVIPLSLNSFNFLKQQFSGRDEQTVNPSADLQRELLRFHAVFNG